MRYFRDTGILFLGGILPLCTLGLNRGLILAMLETVILICGSYFFDRKYTKILLWSIFAVKIVLREHPALYQLCIEDNGKGYSKKEADSEGIGLKNMQERVTSLGGSLQINGENGFRIFAAIPKQQD